MPQKWELGSVIPKNEQGVLRLVACRSMKLQPPELNYPVHEKEMLALVDALEHWRHYLLGAQILVYTDNSALKYLQKTPKPTARQIRWLEQIQQYVMEIVHIPGKENIAADALSRLPSYGERQQSIVPAQPSQENQANVPAQANSENQAMNSYNLVTEAKSPNLIFGVSVSFRCLFGRTNFGNNFIYK